MEGHDAEVPLTVVSVNRFGRSCLDSVQERDVDLLLLEELTCESGFQQLIASLTIGRNAKLLEASNSASTATGESDLIAIYDVDGDAVAVMLENKIGASFMPEQASRYRRRGKAGVRDGHWDRYIPCLIAPRAYLKSDHGEHVFDRQIAYEQLLPYFEQERGVHGAWRAALLRQACDAFKNSYVRIVNDETTEFFQAYWEIARREFPALRMPPEKDRPATNTWVTFRPAVGLPKRTYLYHKGAQGTVDISVSACSAAALHEALHEVLEPDMAVEQSGKSAVVRIQVPPLSMSAGAAKQDEAIRASLRAAERLAAFFARHREQFDNLTHL